MIDHFELQSAMFLTIIQCLFLGPVGPVHDLSKMRMILWQTSVKNGNLNSITFKKPTNVKVESNISPRVYSKSYSQGISKVLQFLPCAFCTILYKSNTNLCHERCVLSHCGLK